MKTLLYIVYHLFDVGNEMWQFDLISICIALILRRD